MGVGQVAGFSMDFSVGVCDHCMAAWRRAVLVDRGRDCWRFAPASSPRCARFGSNGVQIRGPRSPIIKKPATRAGFLMMAEREGFEPSIGLLTLYSLSRGAPSATRPPLRKPCNRLVPVLCVVPWIGTWSRSLLHFVKPLALTLSGFERAAGSLRARTRILPWQGSAFSHSATSP
jgi:hypothetical protein